MSKHTPGPWAVRPNQESFGYGPFDVSSEVIRSTDNYYVAAVMSDVAQAEANARLIAAAPDLLEALKRMHAAFNAKKPIPTDEGNALEAMCRAAITKAEGLDEVGEQGTAKR